VRERIATLRLRCVPGEFGRCVARLCRFYNMAQVALERTGAGKGSLESLLNDSYPSGLIYHRPMAPDQDPIIRSDKIGWESNEISRQQLVSLFDGEAPSLLRKAIQLGLEGNVAALRLCLDRTYPVPMERPIDLVLPPITETAQAPAALSAILAAIGEGQITPGEGAVVAEIVETQGRLLEAAREEQARQELEMENQANRSGSGRKAAPALAADDRCCLGLSPVIGLLLTGSPGPRSRGIAEKQHPQTGSENRRSPAGEEIMKHRRRPSGGMPQSSNQRQRRLGALEEGAWGTNLLKVEDASVATRR
jgi:hypothetical protein